MSDALPTATRVSDAGIRALYRLENRWQAWLGLFSAYACQRARHLGAPEPAEDPAGQGSIRCGAGASRKVWVRRSRRRQGLAVIQLIATLPPTASMNQEWSRGRS